MAVKKKGKLSSLQHKPLAEAPAASSSGFKLPDSLSQIWLAGLGALAKAQVEGPKLLDALIAEGSRVQRGGPVGLQAVSRSVTAAAELVSTGSPDARTQTGERWDNLENIFRDRVSKALQQLDVPTASNVSQMLVEIEELKRRIKTLESERKTSPAPAAPRTRAKVKPAGDA